MLPISIVTVLYNAEKVIEQTIDSVLMQNFLQYEYIFIDGGSSDSTVSLIHKYESLFLDRGINVVIRSEKDQGPYDAMNKGAMHAKGEYILFLNAGDLLAAQSTLADMCECINKNPNADVLYANTIMTYETLGKLQKPGELSGILDGMCFCHQSSIVKTTTFREYMFDCVYKVSADYNLFLSLFISQKKFVYIDSTWSIYRMGGISSNTMKLYSEVELIKNKYNIQCNRHELHLLKSGIKKCIKMYMPNLLYLLYLRKIKEWKPLELIINNNREL